MNALALTLRAMDVFQCVLDNFTRTDLKQSITGMLQPLM